ncbi:MAG: hypothetical protein FWE20_06930 [Defluviitaleaceae bacterium]|nr:hypothetical protein [Defluviitaleaceae bacterium]
MIPPRYKREGIFQDAAKSSAELMETGTNMFLELNFCCSWLKEDIDAYNTSFTLDLSGNPVMPDGPVFHGMGNVLLFG